MSSILYSIKDQQKNWSKVSINNFALKVKFEDFSNELIEISSNFNDILGKFIIICEKRYPESLDTLYFPSIMEQFSKSADKLITAFINLQNTNGRRFLNNDKTSTQSIHDSKQIISTLNQHYDQIVLISDLIKMASGDNNLVFVGPNGAGKSMLANKLSGISSSSIVAIPAQRGYDLSIDMHIPLAQKAMQELHSAQLENRTRNVNVTESSKLVSKSLTYLIADHFATALSHFESEQYNNTHTNPKKTKLQKALDLWEKAIITRSIKFSKDGSFSVIYNESSTYKLIELSDGEKSALHLIAEVMSANEGSMIIIDEPELHLNPSCLSRIWDELENERKDCRFVYLTHDLSFADSRNSADFYLLKQYIPPNNLSYTKINGISEMPRSFYFSIVPSRKPILFCEGTPENSIDIKLYSRVFPEWNVRPAGSCDKVVEYTKSFKEAVRFSGEPAGIIDSDYYRPANQIESWEKKRIFVLNVFSAEQLLLLPEVLSAFEKGWAGTSNLSGFYNEFFIEMEKNLEQQINNYLKSYVHHTLITNIALCGVNKSKLNEELSEFQNTISKLSIEDEYTSRRNKFLSIIESKNYKEALTIFKWKGGISRAGNYFGLNADFADHLIKMIGNNGNLKQILLSYIARKGTCLNP